MAAPYMTRVIVMDIEHDPLDDLGDGYDLLLFSHVLEHLRDPVKVVTNFLTLLVSGGHILVAVPNTLEWRTRAAFMRGRFHYGDHGMLDRTHLRFFTYDTAASELISPIPQLKLVRREGRGSAPLGPLRRHGLPQPARDWIDAFAVRSYPNVFAREVVLLALKERPSDACDIAFENPSKEIGRP